MLAAASSSKVSLSATTCKYPICSRSSTTSFTLSLFLLQCTKIFAFCSILYFSIIVSKYNLSYVFYYSEFRYCPAHTLDNLYPYLLTLKISICTDVGISLNVFSIQICVFCYSQITKSINNPTSTFNNNM